MGNVSESAFTKKTKIMIELLILPLLKRGDPERMAVSIGLEVSGLSRNTSAKDSLRYFWVLDEGLYGLHGQVAVQAEGGDSSET